MPTSIKNWLTSKPGPFVARTHDDVWSLAWRNFCAGPTGGSTNELLFMVHLQQAGFSIRALAIGGYALDRVT
jgi:hypothetical protein